MEDLSSFVHRDNIILTDNDEGCSYRSKLERLYRAIYHWKSIASRFNLHHIPIKVRCYGLEVIKVTRRYHYKPTTNIVHYDMISTLHYLVKEMNSKPTFDHIKGHQDSAMKELDH